MFGFEDGRYHELGNVEASLVVENVVGFHCQMLGWFDIIGAVWVSAEGTQSCFILLLLPGSIADLLKEVLPTLNWGYGADSILMGERDNVIVVYVALFDNRFWDFIPPIF